MEVEIIQSRLIRNRKSAHPESSGKHNTDPFQTAGRTFSERFVAPENCLSPLVCGSGVSFSFFFFFSESLRRCVQVHVLPLLPALSIQPLQ